MLITSINNEQVKKWTKLQQSKYRKEFESFIVEGEHLIVEACKAGIVSELIILAGYDYKLPGIACTYVSKEVMKKISTNISLNNIVAVCRFITNDNNELSNKIVVLENLQDPSNVGAILRVSLALGYNTVLISDHSVDIYNPKLIKATQGAIFKLNIIRDDVLECLLDLKQKQYQIISTDLKAENSLEDIKKNDKFCLVFGNEGSGVSEEVLKISDLTFKIKMDNGFDSLNVLSAASICLYQLK